MMTFLRKLTIDRRGATAVEYGLLCGLLALVLFGSIHASGGRAMSIIGTVASAISATD
ncbi:Flp family type IVb pilin [Notoacmeibacter marinus]|uniref:Flp family type IVb pilin n=1 Tax=Notoacmeibacter marinus TaxID=1876515 RepID=UPI000DF10F95|nr:Flp family type IVb pilin [Notoacmeibacter marinus]